MLRTFWRACFGLGVSAALVAVAAQAPADEAKPHPVFEKEIRKYEAADAQAPPPANSIVFVGSSTIDRWNLAKSFPGLPVVNRGLDGARIVDATYICERLVHKYRPTTIVLYAGDNDLAEGELTPAAVFANFQTFLSQVHALLPATRVVFISIKPSIERWALIEPIRQTNRLIKKHCEADPLVSYVDIEPAMLGADGKPRKELFTDGLHLSAGGYQLWTSLVAPHLAGKDTRPADRDVIAGDLGQKLHEHMSKGAEQGFSGALLVAKDGQVVIAKGYGMANREKQIPFSSTTVFDIGSITKQFTGAAIARLEMQGKLSAEDKLSKFFVDVPPDKAEITLHQLLTHSAGLKGDFGGDYEPATRDWLVDQVLQSKLIYAPGKGHRYANSGFSMLAAVVEKVSGQPYETFLREQLWLPAGMTHTGYRLPQWPADAVAHGYRAATDWGTPLDKRWAEDGPYWNLRGNGGVLSTVWDMYRWHQALLGDKILSSEAQDRMFARRVKEGPFARSWYNYGWSLRDSKRGTRITEHNGGNGIFFADFVRYVDDRAVIIAASNRSEDADGDYMRPLNALVFP
ncbi:MAG: serine hydrolase [Pirellulales bacterium]